MADSNLNVNINGRDNLSAVVQQLESKVIRFVGAVSSAFATLKIVGFPVAAAAAFQTELVNVQKTTEFTTAELEKLSLGLKELSLRMNVSVIDLTKIAAAAGQQGLGKTGVEGVRNFTETVARMAAVLGITAEQAATDVGKILNIFKTPIRDVENISSAFNQVSNNSTASGEQLLDVVKRIGDAAGTIDLQQSLGLAATGIDLGLSPEVVGTSFAKVFADMRAKAKDFGRLMNVSASEWIEIVDNDGIGALKRYLAELRKLNSQAQADTIAKFSGQGRIFALVNKLVQDTNNNVLDKNLDNAIGGFATGQSAIEEQKKVLGTLNAQFQILKNSIFTLGDQAGKQLLGPLTTYVAQLSSALQTPAMQSFLEAAGKGVADLVGGIVSLVKYVAELNVNWENFISVLQVFAAVKLADIMLTIAARANPLAGAMNAWAVATGRATTAQVEAAAASASATSRIATGYRSVVEAVNSHRSALASQLQAEQAYNAAVTENLARQRALRQAMNAEAPIRNQATAARAAADAARSSVSTVRDASAAATDALTTQRNQRVEAATRTHQANIAAIEAEFRGRRTAVDRANRDALIAAETAQFRRQMNGFNSYYGSRIAAAERSGLQLIAQAEAEQLRLTAIYEQANARRLASIGQTAAAIAAAHRSSASMAAAETALARAGQAASTTSVAMAGFGTIVRGVGTALGVLVRVASSAFLWITLIYTALDALGLIDRLPGLFNKFTDALGLTSETQRKAAQASKDHAEQMKKERAEVDELVKGYQRLKNGRGGLDERQLSNFDTSVKNGNQDTQSDALKKLAGDLRAAREEVNALNSVTSKASQDAVNQAAAKLKIAKDNLVALSGPDGNVQVSDFIIKEAKQRVDALQLSYDGAKRAAQEFTAQTASGLKVLDTQNNTNLAQLEDKVRGIFTDDSAKLFDKFVANLSEADAKVAKLATEQSNAIQRAQEVAAGDVKGQAKANSAITSTTEALRDAKSQVGLLRAGFEEARKAILASGDQKAIDAVTFLDRMLQQSTDTVTQYGKTLAGLRAKGIGLTGALIPAAGDGKDKGDREFNSQQNAAAEARALAKARIELEKANNAAEANLRKEHNSQLLAIDQEAYEKGVVSIQQYYDTRRRMQLSNNSADTKALQLDLRAVRSERAALAKDKDTRPSDLVKFDADIARIKGQIAVATAQRNSINEQIDRDIEKAREAFAGRITATNIDLAEAVGTDNFESFFGDKLNQYSAQYADFMAQLVQEGGEEGRVIAELIQSANGLKAIGDTMVQIGRRTSLATGEYDRFITGLSTLRENGNITAVEFEAASARARNALAVMMQRDLDAKRTLLQSIADAGQQSTLRFRELTAEIEESQLRIDQLKTKINSVAAGINQQIMGGIKDALGVLLAGPQQLELSSAQQQIASDNRVAVQRLQDNIAFLERARDGVLSGYGGQQAQIDAQIVKARGEIAALKAEADRINGEATESVFDVIVNAAKTLGLSVATSIRDAVTQNMAEQAIGALGGLGGGIGGMLTGVLGNNKETRGTELNPMIVKEQVGKGLADAAKDPIGELYASFKEKTSEAFDWLSESFDGVTKFFTDDLDGALSGLGDMLSNVFSSLTGGGGGGLSGFASIFASFFHTGGIVGQTSTRRMVNPAIFQTATRYHTGGIAGLRPNEVPAVLERGEEVLRRDNPRHSANGGGAGGDNFNIDITVNVESGSSTVQGEGVAGRELGRRISAVVQQEIANQKRPGGLLA